MEIYFLWSTFKREYVKNIFEYIYFLPSPGSINAQLLKEKGISIIDFVEMLIKIDERDLRSFTAWRIIVSKRIPFIGIKKIFQRQFS